MKHVTSPGFLSLIRFASTGKTACTLAALGILVFSQTAHATDSMGAARAKHDPLRTRSANLVTVSQVSNASTGQRVSLWKKLQQPGVTDFKTYGVFLAENPNWPLQNAIQVQAEANLNDRTPQDQILEFFTSHPPLTPAGATAYANALRRNGQEDEANAAITEFFIKRDFTADSAKTLAAAFPSAITPATVAARADRMLWQEKAADAEELLRALPAERANVLRARAAMLQQKSQSDLLLNQLSDAEQNDAGVLLARARWRRQLGFNSSAANYLSKIDETGREEEIAKERHALARSFIAQGDYSGAFSVLADQSAGPGQNVTQNLWLAGWIALRHQQDIRTAANYFKLFQDNVKTPVSRARGAYWLGRAAEAAEENTVAPQWYRVAAQYGTTFYGQLAAEKINQSITLPPIISNSVHDPIATDERLTAADILLKENDTANARLFYKSALNNANEEKQFAVLGNWAQQRHQPHWAVLASKAAQQKGFAGLRAGYPILSKPIRAQFDPRLPPSLALGIIRQESEFDVAARSASNAQGLMQLLPGTAKEVARKVGTPYSETALISQPAKNVKWGSHYLANQLENFSNTSLAIAAYNAGPSRVRQWMQTYGDPRRDGVDWIDWVETLPSYETRNYVQRVTENEKVYAALLSQN